MGLDEFKKIKKGMRQMLSDLTRRYAAHHDWPNKPTKECNIVHTLCESMKAMGDTPYNSIAPFKEDPPDCIATDHGGNRVGIEVRELVSQKMIESNQKGKNELALWSSEKLVIEIGEILLEKDAKDYKGGPYSDIALVIHSDEPTIANRHEFVSTLRNHVFDKPRQIGTAFFLFPFDPHPQVRIRPYVKLNISGNH